MTVRPPRPLQGGDDLSHLLRRLVRATAQPRDEQAVVGARDHGERVTAPRPVRPVGTPGPFGDVGDDGVVGVKQPVLGEESEEVEVGGPESEVDDGDLFGS